MRPWLILIALLFSSVPVQAVDSGMVDDGRPGVIVIADDNGGSIAEHVKFYNRIRIGLIPVRVEGICESACTIVLMLPPEQVCATPKASFGFHQARRGDEMAPKLTAILGHRFYPEAVQKWIERHGPLEDEPVQMLADEAIELGIVKACAE